MAYNTWSRVDGDQTRSGPPYPNSSLIQSTHVALVTRSNDSGTEETVAVGCFCGGLGHCLLWWPDIGGGFASVSSPEPAPETEKKADGLVLPRRSTVGRRQDPETEMTERDERSQPVTGPLPGPRGKQHISAS